MRRNIYWDLYYKWDNEGSDVQPFGNSTHSNVITCTHININILIKYKTVKISKVRRFPGEYNLFMWCTFNKDYQKNIERIRNVVCKIKELDLHEAWLFN